jgi:hypothetical protein
MDAIRFSLLAVFLSTSAELKIHDAANSYQMIQSQCLPHIATWWTVFPIRVSQDLTLAILVQSRDGMSP